MTYREIASRLSAANIENAAGEARLLIAHFTRMDESLLRVSPDTPIPDPDGALSLATRRRENREPLQYILGCWSFWRQEYEVSPDCLVPRPDTECLLEQALKLLPPKGRFLDLCTGSGCIAISLACERPDATGVAVELYEKTLALAKRNAVKNGVSDDRLCFVRGDVLHPDFLPSLGTFDLIISNPPYVPTRELAGLPLETQQEPLAALDGGEDGLLFYRRLLAPDYQSALTEDGYFLFEIGYDQADALRSLAKSICAECTILKDYGGNDRVAVVNGNWGVAPSPT